MTEWLVEARPVPVEIDAGYDHADFTPTPITDRLSGVSIMDRLENATMLQLRELANGGTGDVT